MSDDCCESREDDGKALPARVRPLPRLQGVRRDGVRLMGDENPIRSEVRDCPVCSRPKWDGDLDCPAGHCGAQMLSAWLASAPRTFTPVGEARLLAHMHEATCERIGRRNATEERDEARRLAGVLAHAWDGDGLDVDDDITKAVPIEWRPR